MAILKCKMCGGDIQATDNTFGTCESCGSTMTLPKANDDQKVNLFNRANNLRRQNEFDKAISVYESILNLDANSAEAHWGLVLSKYGIEYVEDPKTSQRVPTCRRVQSDSILSDADYLSALDNAEDEYTKSLYHEEAKQIAEIQKGILAISSKEEPYDVFICYKETTDSGSRTKDSTIAQDLYYELQENGYRVFFAKITLEDKLGREYEPYIFSALNSAKVMLVIGTCKENFNSVWVKNEWSRYLAIMKKERSRLLIPCYRDMDAYDIPDELSNLQSEDMSKVGFIQDILKALKKVSGANESAVKTSSSGGAVASNVEAWTKRGFLFLEDSDIEQAVQHFNMALDVDPEYAPLYIGLLCAELKLKLEADLANYKEPLDDIPQYKRAMRFADEDYKAKITGYNDEIKKRLELERPQREVKKQQLAKLRQRTEEFRSCVSIGGYHAMGLKTDGAVVMAGYTGTDSWRYVIAVLAAKRHAVGLKVDGRVVAAGDKKEDQLYAGWRNITAVSTSLRGEHVAGLKADGTVVAVGDNGHGQCNTGEWADIVAVFSGEYHTVGLKAGGTVVSVGTNQYGQCKTDSWSDISTVSAGYVHTAGLKTDGTVVAVGANEYGECKTDRWSDIVAVSVGQEHTVGLRADGTVLAAGRNEKGRRETSDIIGTTNRDGQTIGVKSDHTVIALVGDLKGPCDTDDWSDIISVCTGDHHTVGLKADGTVLAVGDNLKGQCNTDGWSEIVAVYAGESNTAGLKADGTVVVTGENRYGQCDTAEWTDIGPVNFDKEQFLKKAQERIESEKELALQLLPKIKESRMCLSAGNNHTVGLKTDGTVVAVGNNGYEQCNTGDWSDIIAVSAGSNHTVGLKKDGTVVAVGDNKYDQCNTDRWSDIIAVAAGYYHTVGLKANGSVIAVGKQDNGQCKTDGWSDIIAILAGEDHTSGLKKDGTVIAVGNNGNGQCKTDGWVDIIAIAAGREGTFGIKADGTVVTTISVGSMLHKEEHPTAIWRNIAAVSTGRYYTVGLMADGTVVAVGDKEYGQCDTGNWNNIVAVAAGEYHTVGLKTDGTVVAIGKNDSGQRNVSNWSGIGPYSEEKAAQKKNKQSQDWIKQGLCRHCGGQMGGLLSKKCKVCGKPG